MCSSDLQMESIDSDLVLTTKVTLDLAIPLVLLPDLLEDRYARILVAKLEDRKSVV